MTDTVLLETGVLSLLVHPRPNAEARRCASWIGSLVAGGMRVVVPEIADYGLRRGLLLKGFESSRAKLDELISSVDYQPLDTATMRLAAEYWAQARRIHRPTASNAALDGDVILAAQAEVARQRGASPVVATTNVRHLEMFVPAREWSDIV